MENNKTISLTEKIKAFAITFIGAGIFSQGTFYFKEQNSYNIPRVLYPVFELLGNIGLAVAMLFLGLALVYWGYTKWKNTAGNAGTFAVVSIVSFALFFAILFFTNQKSTTQEVMKTAEENQTKGIAQLNATEQPNFENAAIDQHFADFGAVLKEREVAVKSNDEQQIKASLASYTAWSQKGALLMQQLEKPEQKQQFALYIGKLTLQWQAAK